MAKKAKKKIKKTKIVLWRWIIIAIPLIVALMWAIILIFVYNDIPIVYENASPSGVKTLIGLIVLFIIAYGSFFFLELRKSRK